jgi:hypothetical protein
VSTQQNALLRTSSNQFLPTSSTRSNSTPRARSSSLMSRPASAKPVVTHRAKQSSLLMKTYSATNQLELTTPVVPPRSSSNMLFGDSSAASRVPSFITSRINPNSKLYNYLQDTQSRGNTTDDQKQNSQQRKSPSMMMKQTSMGDLMSNNTSLSFLGSKIKPETRANSNTTDHKVGSERLNLDRRELTQCPVLNNEQQLKLLNLQYNNITHISNLESLPNLIFLDLYNNKIKEIRNLDSVPSLRVLMLGKNQITKIEGLSQLKRLDVLDLHSNMIEIVENLEPLQDLRVLNLAGNKIRQVHSLENLNFLTEINLRRNEIEKVSNLDKLPALQRLFLSSNNIRRYADILCIFKLKNILELSIDGNPIATKDEYRNIILSQCSRTLKHFDLKKITEESYKNILVNFQSILYEEMNEEERANAIHQGIITPSTKKVKVALVLPELTKDTTAADQSLDSSATEVIAESPETKAIVDNDARGSNSNQQSQDLPKTHIRVDTSSNERTEVESTSGTKAYIRVNGNTLQVCGRVDLPGMTQATKQKASIDQVHFHKVHYTEFITHKKLLKTLLKTLSESLTLTHNGLETLQQMEELIDVFGGMKRIIISDNLIYTNLKRILKPFCICSFPQLQEFNGRSIQQQDRVNAEKIFKKRQVVYSQVDNIRACSTKSNIIANRYISSVLLHTFTIDKKMKLIDNEWDHFLDEVIEQSMKNYESEFQLQQYVEQFCNQLLDK